MERVRNFDVKISCVHNFSRIDLKFCTQLANWFGLVQDALCTPVLLKNIFSSSKCFFLSWFLGASQKDLKMITHPPIRARWDFQSQNHDPAPMYFNVKLNFKASLFSSTFWFERSFRWGNAILVFWPSGWENGSKTVRKCDFRKLA